MFFICCLDLFLRILELCIKTEPDHDRVRRQLGRVWLRGRGQRCGVDERRHGKVFFVLVVIRSGTPDVEADSGHVLSDLVAHEALINPGILYRKTNKILKPY